MNIDLKFYITIFLRRLPIFVLVSGSIAAAAIALAITLPTTYRSESLLLVESPQIPTALAASTVELASNEQLQIIEQRLMTRANLIEIAQRHRMFEDFSQVSPDEVVQTMQNATELRRTSGRDQATLLWISFDTTSPTKAADVVNDYVTRILEANANARRGQAEGTLDFFEQEVARLSAELSNQSARIIDFQSRNSDALPDSLEYRLGRQTLLQDRLSQIDRDVAQLLDQRQRFVELYNATGSLGAGTGIAQSPEALQLAALRDELASALAVFSDTNPRVKILQSRVAQLENSVKAQFGGEDEAPVETSLLDVQLSEIDGRIEFLREQASRAQAQIETLEDTIERTPANTIAVGALRRDYENIQNQYDQAVARLAQAATGERIELLAKGERITVVEPPSVPNEPTSPNRPLIAVAGVSGGIGAGLGLIVLLEMLNKAIRRPVDLTRGLGITPIATIPYMRSRGEVARKALLLTILVSAVVIGLPAVLYAIHVGFMPLDLLFDRVINRLGL